MIAELVKIGNSKGIRIPQKLLRSSRVRDRVDLSVDAQGRIIIAPRMTDDEIAAGYAAMAADEEYEKEATEWCEGLIADAWFEDENA